VGLARSRSLRLKSVRICRCGSKCGGVGLSAGACAAEE